MEGTLTTPQPVLPRITIQFCTQCKWMLRAAYFAQELLSTFSTSLGEVALQPSTGGTFIVHLYYASPTTEGGGVKVQEHLLWDRKAEGRFPETKELKRKVRDIIDPKRDLGHVDGKKDASKAQEPQPSTSTLPSNTETAIPRVTNSLQSPETIGGTTSEKSPTSTVVDPDPISKTTNSLQSSEIDNETNSERSLTPTNTDNTDNTDSTSRPGSPGGVELVNARGKIVIGGGEGEDFGYCRPGDEDCG